MLKYDPSRVTLHSYAVCEANKLYVNGMTCRGLCSQVKINALGLNLRVKAE